MPPRAAGSDFSSSPWMLLLMLLFALAIVGVVALLYGSERKKYGGPPKFAGPPLAGTARILFVSRRRLPSSFARNLPIRQISLRVTIAGHQPYDAVIKQEVPIAALKRISFYGGTVAVQVDSTNLDYVRIDFGQPIS